MKSALALAIAFLVFGLASDRASNPAANAPAEPAPAYLSNLREVQGIIAGKQNFILLDEDIWEHARNDLGDLRLFSGDTEIPYVIATEHGSESAQRSEAKLLDVESVNGETQFVVDMTGIPEYDEVDLRLASGARDFVALANIEGLRIPSQRAGMNMGSSVLFDLSQEHLGSDFTLKFRSSTFPFLRVRVAQIRPEQVQRAIAINTHVYNSFWTPVSAGLPIEQVGGTTVVTWAASQHAPVSRVVLDVDPSQTNFWRDIEVLTPGGGTITNRSVRRVHLVRDGNLAEDEGLEIELPYEAWGAFKIVIENGQEPPLKIRAAKAFFYERRLYFDPGQNLDFTLYSGNPRLSPPDYEYSKFFHADPNAAVVTLGQDMQNPAYGRIRRLPYPPTI